LLKQVDTSVEGRSNAVINKFFDYRIAATGNGSARFDHRSPYKGADQLVARLSAVARVEHPF
jgi:hypothetical protein